MNEPCSCDLHLRSHLQLGLDVDLAGELVAFS